MWSFFKTKEKKDALLERLAQESLKGGVRLSGCGRSVSLPEGCGRALAELGVPLVAFVNGTAGERDYRRLDAVARRFWELYEKVEAELLKQNKRAYEQARRVACYYSDWKKTGSPPNRCMFRPDLKAQEAISGVIVDVVHGEVGKGEDFSAKFDMHSGLRLIGNCLVACLYYVSIARRLGLDADLYEVPGHFMVGFSSGRDVKYADPALGQRSVVKERAEFVRKDGSVLVVDYRNPRLVDCCGLAPAYRNKGFALMERGRYREAYGALKKAVELDPFYAEALNLLGELSLICGNYDAALKFYAASLRLDDSQTAAWNGKGFALAGLGRHDEALKAIDATLRIDPKNCTAIEKKEELLSAVQQKAKVKQHASTA